MSLKLKLEIDTVEKPLEGFVSSDDGYEIQELLQQAINRHNRRKLHKREEQ